MAIYDLDTVLLNLREEDGNFSRWTIRNAVEGVQIFGGIGSGKTSGSGRTLALKYLGNGFGGLVLTAKPEEKNLWIKYAREANREKDLVIVGPGREEYFDFLEYESRRVVDGVGYSQNIVDLLKTVLQASEAKNSGKADDQFWENSLDMLIRNSVNLCILAYGKFSIRTLYDLVQAAPIESKDKKNEEKFTAILEKAFGNVNTIIVNWMVKQSTDLLVKMEADEVFFRETIRANIEEVRTYGFIKEFFTQTYKRLSDKTRTIIYMMFTGFLFQLLNEPIYSLFCSSRETFRPDQSREGKIIVLDLPVKLYEKAGRDTQILFKYIWQKSMEKVQTDDTVRPVFLWADESQEFVHEKDAVFQATARSSRVATVYISQNMPNYLASMGGMNSENRVKSLLGTLATKIFHANVENDTNNYASDLIGSAYTDDISQSFTVGENLSASQSRSYKLEKMVRCDEFVSLKTGGPENKFITEAYIHKQGAPFANGYNHRITRFNQSFLLT